VLLTKLPLLGSSAQSPWMLRPRSELSGGLRSRPRPWSWCMRRHR